MSEATVKLGLMPPLTGLVGLYGSEIAHAGQVACQEINKNGGVLGRSLELVIEDDGSLPESAVTAAERLVDQHHCTAIIGNLLSNSRIAVAYRVAETRKIPYLNFSFYEGSILSRYFFHFAALPNQQIDKMIPFMRDKFGPRMFFADNNYEWPRGSIHAAKRALKDVGGVVIGEEYTQIGVNLREIDQLLDHVEAANPDVFVPYFAGADQILLLTRFTERGLKKRMAVVMGHYDEMMASQLPPEVREGFYSSNSYFMNLDTVENRKYLDQLAKLPDVNGIWPNGNGILTNFGEGTYVCVKAFASAANKADSLDPEALVEALKTITVSAPQGTVKMNPDHHHANVNAYLSRCRADGVFEIVEQFGSIEPVLPARYKHQRISHQATMEDDIRLQARMLEQMSEAVLLVSSLDTSIIYANAGAEKMFGYDKGEMNEQAIGYLDYPKALDTQQTSAWIIDILNKKGEWQGETLSVKKDGTPIWCSASISTFTHPAYGEVWLWVASNISERKQAEQALQHERDLSNSLINTAPIIVLLLDPKGYIQHVNPYFEQLSGYSLNEIKGQEWISSFLPVRDQDRIREILQSTVHEKPINGNINAIVTRNGEERDIEWYARTMRDANGTVTGVLSIGQDVTERKQAEVELDKYRYHLEERVQERTSDMKAARDEAERANAAKSEFLSRMSHELRTPMNAVLGFAQLLELDEDEFNESQRDNINEIIVAGHHLLNLIDEVLDLAKLESGKLEVSVDQVSIDNLLQQCIPLIATQAEARHLEIIDHISNNGFTVQADYSRLKQVILNLLSNAVKYNCIHGRITLNAEIIDKQRLRIHIIDTGKGLSEDDIAKLFTSFEHLDNVNGIGIGLVITKHLIELMDGTIGVESTPGVGSSFWVELKLFNAA